MVSDKRGGFPPKSITFRSGRHPHEIGLLVMSLVIGLIGLAVEPASSPALSSSLSGPLLSYFFLVLILSAIASFVGALMNSITGLLWERAGMYPLSAMYVAYSMAVLMYGGLRGITSAMFGLAIAVASVVRIVQIHRDLKKVRLWMQEQAITGVEVHEPGRRVKGPQSPGDGRSS